MKHPISIKYIQYAQQGTKLGEYREVNPEDYVIDPVTYNRRNKYTGEQVTFLPEGMGEEGVVVTGKRIYPMFSPEQRAQKAAESNARDRVIASQYFNETPSIGNLVKGAYHFTRGTLLPRSENPEDYNPVQKLTAPDVPTFSLSKLTSLTRGKIPRLMQKVGNDGPNLNVQAMEKIGGLPVPTGKTRTLKEAVGTRPDVKNTEKAINPYVEGFNRGRESGMRQADKLVSQDSRNYVSKQAAQKYAKLRVEKSQREMDKINKLNKDNNQKRVQRAFDLGKQRGESLAKSQNVNSVKSPTNAAKSSTDTVSKSNEKLSIFQKLKQKVKSKPVKTGLTAAGILGLADIVRVSVLNQDPTRDAKLVPIEIFNWVSNGLMSKEGRQYKLVGDQIESLKNEQRLDSLKGVRDKMLSSQQTSSSQNAPNDTIGLNTIQLQQMQPNKNVDNSDQVTDF